jgi:hypothetical protein
MKPQLLEYLVRACTREVLKQLNENDDKDAKSSFEPSKTRKCSRCKTKPAMASYSTCKDCHDKSLDDAESYYDVQEAEGDETKGAAAPPADGQGTADQPAVPKTADSKPDEKPSQPETPKPEAPKKTKPIQGINVINPRDKAEMKPLEFRGKDPATIERTLFNRASAMAGSKVKVALSTIRAVTNALANPSTPLFLYIGKVDPDSDDLFMLSDNSLQVAKDSTADLSVTGTADPATYNAIGPSDPTDYDPDTMGAAYAQRQAGFSDRARQEPEIEFGDNSMEEQIRKLIKKMVNETLDPR